MRNKLKILRVTNEYNQKEMAELMDVSYPAYRLIEVGKTRGNTDFWLTLQKKFNLSDNELVELMKCNSKGEQ